MPTEMKEIIAQAAQRLISEKHIKKLTVKDIAEECQITRQSFYYHFEDIPALFRYILQRDGERLQRKSNRLNDPEEALKHFFHMAINAIPDIRRGMQTNYREELQQLMYEYIYRLLEAEEEKVSLYAGFSSADKKLFLRYHSCALLGILQQWGDKDTDNLDEIVHKLYLLLCSQPPTKNEI